MSKKLVVISLIGVSILLGILAFYAGTSGFSESILRYNGAVLGVGLVSVAFSTFIFRTIVQRTDLSFRIRLAAHFGATFPAAFGGLAAISWAVMPTILPEMFWWVSLVFAMLGALSFQIAIVLAAVFWVKGNA